MDWTPVVDISKHQGDVDFAKMRSAGVEGVIIRATHGETVDGKLTENVAGARRGGYQDADLGFYSFINPKRGSSTETATATVQAIDRALGHTDTLYMLDIEFYRNEPPERGQAPVFGAAFSRYLRQHMERVRALAPGIHIIAYSNASFWDRPVSGTNQKWVGDPALAAELDWIVPRYPVWPPSRLRTVAERNDWATTSPKPPKSPSGWADWAFDQQPAGPKTPSGVEWAGWQFSADYNRLGGSYGCSSVDLDLNIVRREKWQEWTGSARSSDWVALASGDELKPGEARTTDDGHLNLTTVSDGDVAVQRVIWSTGTGGKNAVALVMQPDGNLVQRDGTDTVLFETGTGGNPGAELRVDRNGVAAVVAPDDRVLWSSSDGLTTPGVGRRKTARVQRGDGWIRIAERELGDGSRWQELRDLNGGSSRVLHEGDEIRLP